MRGGFGDWGVFLFLGFFDFVEVEGDFDFLGVEIFVVVGALFLGRN